MKSKHYFDQSYIDQAFTWPTLFTQGEKTRTSKYDRLKFDAMKLYLDNPSITIQTACCRLNKLHLQLPTITTEEPCCNSNKLQHPIKKSTLHYNLVKWNILAKESK